MKNMALWHLPESFSFREESLARAARGQTYFVGIV
jgi:hypothetical protein